MPTFAHKIYLEKKFNHPVASVFHAFQDVNKFKQWWGPKHCKIGNTKFDFFVGGRYRIELIRLSDQQSFFVKGQFSEIVENNLIQYTYHYEGLAEPPFQESQVTIQFSSPDPATTLIRFTQEFIDRPKAITTRTVAWEYMFKRLDTLLNGSSGM